VVFMPFALVLEGPHNPPPIVGCLAWFWFKAPQIPAAAFSFSRSFIDLAGAGIVLGFFVVDDVPRERFHRSSKFAEVAGLTEVCKPETRPGEIIPPCCGGEVADMMEVLIL